MINILLESYGINEKWLYNELKHYIKSDYTVAVIAFSFRDSIVKSEAYWNKLYGKQGKYYDGIVGGFKAYGISEDNIKFVNYFTDSKKSAEIRLLMLILFIFSAGCPTECWTESSNLICTTLWRIITVLLWVTAPELLFNSKNII